MNNVPVVVNCDADNLGRVEHDREDLSGNTATADDPMTNLLDQQLLAVNQEPASATTTIQRQQSPALAVLGSAVRRAGKSLRCGLAEG